MTEHALLSASASPRWINCPGSLLLCKGIEQGESEFAKEGTAAHELGSLVLNAQPGLYDKTIDYLGMTLNGVEVDEDMVEYIQEYVDYVRQFAGVDKSTVMIEKRVDYSSFIGVEDSFGTSDVIIISPDGKELTIIDLKYGRGVKVYAEENEQLMLYALGAIDELSIIYDKIERIRLVVHQPRLDNISEWDCTIEELMVFSHKVGAAAELAEGIYSGAIPFDANKHVVPGDAQCKWCAVKALCPALKNFVENRVAMGFEDLDRMEEIPVNARDNEDLSLKMKAVPLIETWCKAVRAAVEAQVFDNQKVPGFKLVGGRKGRRKWIDMEAVEEMLKAMRLKVDEMYTKKIISPTKAEKLMKENPRQWAKIKEMIIQPDGKPSVVPVSDPRKEIEPVDAAGGFDEVEDEE